MSNQVRLDPAIWRDVGASIETAYKCGLFGGKAGRGYISLLDKEQARERRAIVEQVREKWANLPLTYTRSTETS